MLLYFKQKNIFLISCFFLFFIVGCSTKNPINEKNKKNIHQNIPVRGIWIATVSCLDWPSVTSVNIHSDKLRIKVQKKTLIDKLDNLVKIGINTVFFKLNQMAQHSIILIFFPGLQY